MIIDRKYKFIIIDDHPFIRDGIRNYISAHDSFEFIGEFSETRSVINSTFPGKPDIIILDLNLPGIDGEKSCELLKRKFPDCKVVAFTQYTGRGKELNKLGFDGYLQKSETDSLIEALLSVMKGEKYFKNDDKASAHEAVTSDKEDAFLKIKQLTPRELEVAKYIVQDFSNRGIGERIFISESTVETHRKHIKEKLKIKNKHELYTVLRSYNFD